MSKFNTNTKQGLNKYVSFRNSTKKQKKELASIQKSAVTIKNYIIHAVHIASKIHIILSQSALLCIKIKAHPLASKKFNIFFCPLPRENIFPKQKTV